MNIIVLANAFERKKHNARLRSQCDMLVKMGHQVEVYTEPWDDLEFQHEYPIYEIGEIHSNAFRWFLATIYSVLTNYKERHFAYQILWQIRKTQFDIVYCSTNSTFPLGAAYIISKRKHIPLHVDLYEMTELVPKHKDPHAWMHPFGYLLHGITLHRRNKVLRRANAITSSTPQHVALLRKYNRNVTLLYNGFNPDEYFYQEQKTDAFRINYFGYLHRSQNTELILKVRDEMMSEIPDLHWTFYSNHLTYSNLTRRRPDVRGLLPFEVIPDTIRQTSIVLLVDDKYDNGVQSEQLYRALGCEKPVIFTPTQTGLLPEIIRLSNAGLCADNTTDIKNFIRSYYEQWKQTGYTHQPVANKELFNAELHAQQLINLFTQQIKQE